MVSSQNRVITLCKLNMGQKMNRLWRVTSAQGHELNRSTDFNNSEFEFSNSFFQVQARQKYQGLRV